MAKGNEERGSGSGADVTSLCTSLNLSKTFTPVDPKCNKRGTGRKIWKELVDVKRWQSGTSATDLSH